MTISKETKAYVISLTKQALVALENNNFGAAEDYLRSANGELHDSLMDLMDMSHVKSRIDILKIH